MLNGPYEVKNKNAGTNSKAMSWALRFVVTQGEYESQQVPILHAGYLTK